MIAIGSNGGELRPKPEVIELRDRARAGCTSRCARRSAEFADMGIQVKDVDRGLIDFPAVIDGQDAAALLAGRRAADRASGTRRRTGSPDGGRCERRDASAGRARRRGARPIAPCSAGQDPARRAARRRATRIWHRMPRPGRRSWGRLLGALKMAILAGDGDRGSPQRARRRDRRRRLAGGGLRAGAGARRRSVGCRMSRRCWTRATEFARTGRALAALAAADAPGYAAALGEILDDFEARDQHLYRGRVRRHGGGAGTAGRAARHGRPRRPFALTGRDGRYTA